MYSQNSVLLKKHYTFAHHCVEWIRIVCAEKLLVEDVGKYTQHFSGFSKRKKVNLNKINYNNNKNLLKETEHFCTLHAETAWITGASPWR